MGSSFSPQSELAHTFLGLAQGYPVATRCMCDCIMRVAQGIKGHADLASSSPSSPVSTHDFRAHRPEQSRQTLVTGNEGCVRYPT